MAMTNDTLHWGIVVNLDLTRVVTALPHHQHSFLVVDQLKIFLVLTKHSSQVCPRDPQRHVRVAHKENVQGILTWRGMVGTL